MSVANIAQTFKLEDSKGDLDYHLPRAVGWEVTEEERDYIVRDVRIVAQALAIQIREGMVALTVGSDSLNEYKDLTGKKMFTRLFPVLPLTMDTDIRKAYRGGFTYVNEKFKGKRVGAGSVYDVNSLYPFIMYDRMLPWGEPVFFDGQPEHDEDMPLYIVSITFTARLKQDKIPCIQIKGSMGFVAVEYQTVIDEPITLSCTNVDLALWQDQYDLEILSYNGGWKFKATHGLFDEFIDKWSEIKANSTGGLRAIAKLHLNALYGKFATNPKLTPKYPKLEEGVVKLATGKEETKNPVYTPMGVFITSYARDLTIRAAQDHYSVFVYADTDSLHLVTQEPVLDVHPTRMGAWKHEYNFSDAIFARAKCYTELTDHGFETHIAGMPARIAQDVTFDDYVNGKRFEGKLQPKRVPGGIVLTDVGFTLNL